MSEYVYVVLCDNDPEIIGVFHSIIEARSLCDENNEFIMKCRVNSRQSVDIKSNYEDEFVERLLA